MCYLFLLLVELLLYVSALTTLAARSTAMSGICVLSHEAPSVLLFVLLSLLFLLLLGKCF